MSAAKKHLRARGLSEKTLSKVLTRDGHPVAYGIDCEPSEGPVFERDGRLVINTYAPPRIKPAAGEWPRIRAMMETVTAGDGDGLHWLLHWMAAKYQRPAARSMTAPVFQGAQGIGKTQLGNIFATLLGPENTASISQADLDTRFNGHFARKLFIVADEVVNRGKLYDSASALKKYITDPTVTVDIKNVPQRAAPNHMSWWFTSNETTPVLVEGRHDRRYTVFSAFEPPTSSYRSMLETVFRADGGYTEAFEQEMAAFAFELAGLQVDNSLVRMPFENSAREMLICAGRSSVEQFLEEVDERGFLEVVKAYLPSAKSTPWDFGDSGVRVETLYSAYRHFCEASGTANPSTREALGQHVRRVFPDASRSKVTSDGARVPVYRGLPRHGR